MIFLPRAKLLFFPAHNKFKTLNLNGIFQLPPTTPPPQKKKLPGQEMLLLTMKTRALYSLTRLKCMSSLASEILSLFSDELFWQLYLHTPF